MEIYRKTKEDIGRHLRCEIGKETHLTKRCWCHPAWFPTLYQGSLSNLCRIWLWWSTAMMMKMRMVTNMTMMRNPHWGCHLSRTLPAQILNVSTTATLLPTTGKLFHAIQDRPGKIFMHILLSVSKLDFWRITNYFTCSQCTDTVDPPSPSPPLREQG